MGHFCEISLIAKYFAISEMLKICHAINWGLIQCMYFQFVYVDYDWCEANPQWFWPHTYLYEWVDGVQK